MAVPICGTMNAERRGFLRPEQCDPTASRRNQNGATSFLRRVRGGFRRGPQRVPSNRLCIFLCVHCIQGLCSRKILQRQINLNARERSFPVNRVGKTQP